MNMLILTQKQVIKFCQNSQKFLHKNIGTYVSLSQLLCCYILIFMNADPGLLQYYVYKFLQRSSADNRPQEQEDFSLLEKTKSMFRNRGNTQFMIQEFEFLNKLTHSNPFKADKFAPQKIFNQPLIEIVETANKTLSDIKTKKKRISLPPTPLTQQEQTQSNSYNFFKAYKHNQNYQSPINSKIQRIKSFQSENTSSQERSFEKLNNHKSKILEFENQQINKKKAYFGLQIKRLQLENSFTFKKTSTQLPPPPKTNNYSRIKLKKKHKFFEIKQIPNFKENRDTIFEQKARKYKDFIFKLYLCNGVYIDLKSCAEKYERKKQKKYMAYVGNGNNSNLIKILLKKRWWWTISNQINSETSFVWTQLKIKNCFQKQKNSKWYSPVLRRNDLFANPKPLAQQNKKEHCLRLMNAQDYQIYLEYFSMFKRQPEDFKLRFKLCNKSPITQLQQGIKVHNHFQFNGFIGNKKALFRNLTDFYAYYQTPEESRNIPLTFHIKTNKCKEIKNLVNAFKQRQKSKKKNIWIVKPGENSNRGQGIKVCRTLSDILAILQDQSKTHIVQQYLHNLFLYNKRKFDIRTYMLVTQIQGCMKAYWYQQGYIRTSSQAYRLDDLSDKMVHLTNDAIQKNGENYGKYEPGNKLSYSQLQKYLDTHNYKHCVANLVDEMKRIAKQTFLASYFKIDKNLRQHNFEIFGFDFIIDKDFRPWLLQVNTNPCLQLSSPLLQKIIPSMVQNAFRIALDPLFPPTACPYTSKPYLADNIVQKNRFEIIFDSQYDRLEALQRLYENDNEQYQYEEESEVYENEGSQCIELNQQ